MTRYLLSISLCLCLAAGAVCAAELQGPGPDADLRALYLDLHRNPELSRQERQTSARMADELEGAGFEVTTGVGGYGVAAVYRNGDGPTVLVRADMDALPLEEQTGLPYASSARAADAAGNGVGVMHACGHDMHMTVLVGSARRLVAARDRWSGTLVFIAQPAEEIGAGAAAMIADGLFERFPRPDANLALHLDPSLAAGTVGYTPGYAMAAVDSVDIVIHGIGGHGAYPQDTIDPVVLAARTVMALQTLVSREIPPLEPAVVTVGTIHGGSKRNIIPDEVKLELTIRTFDDGIRDRIFTDIGRLIRGIGLSAGLAPGQLPELVMSPERTPSLYNDPQLCARVAAVWKSALGEGRVVEVPKKMIGEDFARYGRVAPRIPSLLFWLGTAAPRATDNGADSGVSPPSLHSARFAPPLEPTLHTGIEAMTLAVLELMR